VQVSKGDNGFAFFFLAMTHQRLGNPEVARRWYDKGVQWMDQRIPQHKQLARFRIEAEETLGLNKSATSQPSAVGTEAELVSRRNRVQIVTEDK
jgi:hypothetical protein